MPFWRSLKGDQPSHIGGSSTGGEGSSHGQQPPRSPRQDKDKQAYEIGQAQVGPGWAADNPPPYHDWQSIPDTALLPPPPGITNKYSPTGNAEESEAIRAHQFCDRYPLIEPHQPTPDQVVSVQAGRVELQRPREYAGTLSSPAPGYWKGATRSGAKDSALLSAMPLYFENVHSPYRTGRPKTIYFEVKVLSFGHRSGSDENALAIGFCAVPYPTWRMPGWERGSIGVHSDDGRRYVNDTEGGMDFTSPFQPGDTIGLGIHFSVADRSQDSAPTPTQRVPLKGRVFLTRNGVNAGGWDLQEEMDSSIDLGTVGVDGKYDLYAAVGTFGKVEFEVNLGPGRWLWNP